MNKCFVADVADIGCIGPSESEDRPASGGKSAVNDRGYSQEWSFGVILQKAVLLNVKEVLRS